MITGDDVTHVDPGPPEHSDTSLVGAVPQVLAIAGQPVVSLTIDGLRVGVSFDLDNGEH